MSVFLSTLSDSSIDEDGMGAIVVKPDERLVTGELMVVVSKGLTIAGVRCFIPSFGREMLESNLITDESREFKK